MMPDELTDWLEANPEVMTCPLPPGWRRLDSVPLRTRRVALLHADGVIYRGPVTNPYFIIAHIKPIAWRPVEEVSDA